MPSPRVLAEERVRRQRAITAELTREARDLWRRVERGSIADSWLMLMQRLLVLFTAAQLASAEGAEEYIAAVLAEEGVSVDAEGRLNPYGFAGTASDGRSLEGLLYRPVVASLTAIESGVPVGQAMGAGGALLDTIVLTQLADVGRAAVGVGVTQRRGLGYVRMVVGATCGRCVVLAGRWYRWNAGFQRHPRCDCIGVPARENTGGDIRTDPDAWFRSLSRGEQDRQFTKAGAQAIRDGADIARVVNSRRGAYGLSTASGRLTAAEKRALVGERGRLRTRNVFGRELFTTAEATTKRGINRKIRLMPESIYSIAESREDAIRLLKVHGYIL